MVQKDNAGKYQIPLPRYTVCWHHLNTVIVHECKHFKKGGRKSNIIHASKLKTKRRKYS